MLLQLNDHRRVTLGKGDFSDIKRESDRETSRFGSSDNLFFKHPQLSKAHGRLMNDDGRLLLMDVGSSFGTVVNDEFIKPHNFVEVKDFDRIGFIIMRSVSYIKNVVDMSEDNLIPLSHFGHPGVMLQFRLVVNKNDEYPHSIDVEFVPVAHLHSRKPNDNSNDEITIFENFESDNEEQQASERFENDSGNDNGNDEPEVIDVDEVVLDEQEDDSEDSEDSDDSDDSEDSEDSEEKAGNSDEYNSVASYDLGNEDDDTPQSDIEENATNDPYSYKKYIFGDGEQSDEDDYDYEVNCSDAIKDNDSLLSEEEGDGSDIEDFIGHISPMNYVLNSDEDSEDSEDEDYKVSHRKKETEGDEEEEDDDSEEEEEDSENEEEEEDSEDEDVNDAKEPEDKYIGWLSSEIIAHLVHQGLLNYNDVVDSGDSVSGDDYCGDDYCGDCNSCGDSEELNWELSDLEDDDLNEDLCYTYNPQQTKKPNTIKSVMKEVGKGMFYVISTVVILGIYGSYQQRNQ